MKKFLTVLLALSVVFTYSFSSVGAVFADAGYDDRLTTDEQKKIYTEVAGANDEVLIEKVDAAIKNAEEHNIIMAGVTADNSYKVTAAAYEPVRDEAIAAAKDYLVEEILSGKSIVVLKEKLEPANLLGHIDWRIGTDVVREQFVLDMNAEIAKLETVDATEYVKADKVKEEIDVDIEAINAAILQAKETNSISNYDTVIKNAKGLVNSVVKEITIEYDGVVIGTGKYEMIHYKKLNDPADEATKAALKAKVAAEVAAYKQRQVEAGKKIDETLVAAYEECFDVLIEEGVTTSTAAILAVDSYADPNKLVANYDDVQELVAFAERYKAERDEDGNLVRDAKTVDEIVWKAKVAAYSSVPNKWNGLSAAMQEIVAATVESDAKGLAYAQKSAKTAFDELVAEAEEKDTYYPAELAAVKALVAEFGTKVDALTKTKDVAPLFNAYQTKIAKVNDKAKVKTLLTVTNGSEFNAAKTVLKENAALYNKNVAANAKLDASDNIIENVLVDFYGKNGARTLAEMKALKPQIAGLVSELPTAAAQSAALKAAKDAIEAIPATITLADEAVVQAAVDAVKAYEDLYGNLLSSAEKAKLEKAKVALADAFKADLVRKAATVDKTDKTAVRALIAEIKAVTEKNCVAGNSVVELKNVKTTLEGVLENIRLAEKDAVIKAIKAIPVNVTEADKAVVEAARKAYDAYVEDWTDYNATGVNGKNPLVEELSIYYRVLSLAEATLGLNYDPAKDVEAFKISAKTKRYDGSKIRISWTVKGNESAIDGYRIYYSTKRTNTGYKYLAKTTKKYINHTSVKKIKKGTRVFYKVRAYKDIDGKRIFSDYSNPANRLWK